MIRAIWLIRTLAMVACLVPSSQTLAQKPYPEIVEIIAVRDSDPLSAQQNTAEEHDKADGEVPLASIVAISDSFTQPPSPIGDQSDWVTTDDYPSSAQREGAEGVTTTMLTVDSNGFVSRCEVTSSSGNAALDTAACQALQLRARYAPALDSDGNPTDFKVLKRVRWQLPDSLPSSYPPISVGTTEQSGLMVLRVHILPRRRVDFCEVINIKREKSDLTERLCPHALDLILLSPVQDIPQEGLWFETILSQGMFSTDPDWMEQDEQASSLAPAADGTPPPLPPPPAPEPLPEGVT